jgi:hypothetical protein
MMTQTGHVNLTSKTNHFHHVRMMTMTGSTQADIILDSGADTSALPLAYSNVGESCSHETIGHDYIDAQGGKLDICVNVSSLPTSVARS